MLIQNKEENMSIHIHFRRRRVRWLLENKELDKEEKNPGSGVWLDDPEGVFRVGQIKAHSGSSF